MTAENNVDMKTKLEKTLSLNSEMQCQLLKIREKLEKLLSNVKDAYASNNVLLKEGILLPQSKGVGIKGAYLKGGTFYLKGNMFFKDIKCRNCPNNPDYENRKKENEMFPMDLTLKSRHVWSNNDKKGIVLGIKEQIIDYLTHSNKRPAVKSKEVDSKKLAKLLTMVPDDFRIDWDNISSCNLQHRHSAKTCEAIWNLFLHPSLKRSSWTEIENQKLLEAAKKHNFQNWQEVAKEVGQRSDFQCFVQFQSNVCHMLPESYTKWSKEDDKRLLDVIARNTVNGVINWSNVNAYFPHKAKTTLHSRYNFTLNPDIKRGAQFTPEEDLLLIAAVKEYGNKFSCIPRSLFPNRSLIQLRSHYNNVLSKRHNHQPWTLEDDIKLMDFVTEKGAKSWLECERYLNERHSRASCRTRFLTIKKFLEKNPNSTVEDLPRKHSYMASAINITNWKEKVDELSLNPNGVAPKVKKELSDNELSRMEKEKKERKKKPAKKEKLKKPPKSKFKKEQNDKSETIVEEIIQTEENVQDELAVEKEIPTNVTTLPVRPTVSEKKVKPYIHRLRSNGVNNYNFFKYAYNFELNRYPCDNIQISEDFAIVFSALNPKIPSNFVLDSSFPDDIKQNIIETLPHLPTCEKLELLPPSWSTAMGFRAMCINTAGISANIESDHLLMNKNNDYIKRFRNRLRSIFYSTALLSRLAPGMVGITTVETQPRPTKRKKSICTIDKEECAANNKIKRFDFIDNIKTEFET